MSLLKLRVKGVNKTARYIVYGPVPSRRLGHSLGINNIPLKIGAYSCLYCQLGNTIKLQVERGNFYEVEEIVQGVKDKVKQVREKGEPIDYLTFIPDGEPTLDINLGKEIELLKPLGQRSVRATQIEAANEKICRGGGNCLFSAVFGF